MIGLEHYLTVAAEILGIVVIYPDRNVARGIELMKFRPGFDRTRVFGPARLGGCFS